MVLDAGPHLDAAISLIVNGTGMYNFHNAVVSPYLNAEARRFSLIWVEDSRHVRVSQC